MHWCCPPGHGCNAPNGAEPCALELCRAAATQERDAAEALARWRALEDASDGPERRFRRRAFQRTRDRALIALAMRLPPGAAAAAVSLSRRRRSRARAGPRQGLRLAPRG